jgi:hypothetical protein
MPISKKRAKANKILEKELDKTIIRKDSIENKIVNLMTKALEDGNEFVVLEYAKQKRLGGSNRECLLRTAANL